MQTVTFSPNINLSTTKPMKASQTTMPQNNFPQNNDFMGAQLVANQNIAFMSRHTSDRLPIPDYDKKFVDNHTEGNESYFLRENPKRFYVLNGLQVNNFLRKDELLDVYDID